MTQPEQDTTSGHATPAEQRFEDIVLAYLKALDAGQVPDRQRLLSQYPELAEELWRFFADQDRVASLLRPFRAPAGPIPEAPSQVGDYALLGEIGRGGMGVIYKARQISAGRTVALKMIRDHHLLTDSGLLQRFRLEAHNVAQLDHPHIVPIYDVGEFQGQPYFSMKLIEGGSLARPPEALTGNYRVLAGMLAAVARAVHHAHRRGILHRDLKPANVLLDGTHPYVVDFGLAKRVVSDSTSITERGAIIGTYSYMAPEQASGEKGLTTAADVYGVGAILYELLAGRPPFKGATVLDTLVLVKTAAPEPPRKHNKKIPRDLELICLKCLEKAPERRYASAEELAEDLDHFCNGQATRVRPASTWEKAIRWAKKRPAVAALSAALLLTVVLGFVAVLMESDRRWQAQQRAEKQAYVANYLLAHREAEAGRFDRANTLLSFCPEKLRRWEWYFLNRRCQEDTVVLRGHSQDVNCVACSPDGKWIVSGGSDGAVMMWPVADLGKGPIILEQPDQTMNGVSAVGFSRDGRRLVTAHERYTVRVWDTASRELLFSELNAGSLVALNPDGSLVAAARGGVSRVWRVRDQHLLQTLQGKYVNDLAFGLDGRVLVTVGYGGLAEVRFWDPQTGRSVRPLRNEHQSWVSLLAFHPNPKQEQLATTQGSIVSLWNLKTGGEQRLQRGDSHKLTALSYAEGGRHLATASNSGVLTVWDTKQRKVVFSARRGKEGVPIATSFLPKDPDLRIVYTRGSGVILERWQKVFDREDLLLRHPAAVRGVSFNPQGGMVVAAAEDGFLIGWDVNTGRQRFRRRYAEERPKVLSFSPDGRFLAVASPENTLRLVDARTGANLKTLTGFQGEITALNFDAEGGRLAAGLSEKRFYVWDLSGGELFHAGQTDAMVSGVAFAPDGHQLAVGSISGLIRIWDLRSRKQVRDMGLTKPVVQMGFQPDGTLLACLHSDGVVYSWNVVAVPPRPEQSTDTDLGGTLCLAFSADGRRLATADEHGSIYISEPESGRVYLSLRGTGSRAVALAFSPDGHRLACVSRGRQYPRLERHP